MDEPFEAADIHMLREVRLTLLVTSTANLVLLGMYVVLATSAMYTLYHTTTLQRRTFWMLAAFTMASGGAYVGVAIGTTGAAYGAVTFGASQKFSKACASLIATFVTLAGILSDGLLTYRCWIIWGRSRWVCVSIAILLAEVVCFLIQNVRLSIDGIAWASASSKAALVALSLNLGLNVILALAAIARLMRARSELRRAALPTGGHHYVEISRLLAAISIVYVAAWTPTLHRRSSTARCWPC